MKSSFKNYLQRINSLLGKIETGLLCLVVAMMIGLAILEIVMRYGFNKNLLWKHLMLQNLTLWLCFLGAALASSEKKHISIDVLSRILPENTTRYISYIIDFLSLIVVSILAYYGFDFLTKEQESHRNTDRIGPTLVGKDHYPDRVCPYRDSFSASDRYTFIWW